MAGAAVELGETFEVRAAKGRFPGFAVATLVVLALGGMEGWYGKTVSGDVYGSDAVQYLDIARAFERGDWHSVLNPLWSQGYPALLALARPMFAAGNAGEWDSIRFVNFSIFALCWACFCWFLRELLWGRGRSVVTMFGAVCVFLTAQIGMDQVSRVGPDELVAAIFLLVCGLSLRMYRRPGVGSSVAIGAALGIGFLVKSIFLPLGFAALFLVAFGLLLRRHKAMLMAPGVAAFAAIFVPYGMALSHEFGAPTLGEAGSLNYAWHVDRLAKWVHWEGGVDAADKAWPKPWIAGFAHWDTDPPDFGRPVHPSEIAGTSPTVYVFHAPVEATYVPYFDPPYWYEGYRHVVRWRYQVIAIGKNLGDFALVLVKQPLVWTMTLAFLFLSWGREARAVLRASAPAWIGETWPAYGLAAAGLAIYLPVHLEGRYIAAFLAVLLAMKLEALAPAIARSRLQQGVATALIGVGFLAGLVKDQHEVWARAAHGWDYRENLEWREGEALRAAGFTPRSEIGVIGWTPNVQCDWAYLADLRITSEIASAADEKLFWELDPLDRNAVLLRFRQAGAVAVVTRDGPKEGAAAGWDEVGTLPLWVYRF